MMQDKPYLSLDERDRRYKLVRDAMKHRGLDALLVYGDGSKWGWLMANIHYLSGGVGGNGEEAFMVFPLDGEPTVILWGAGADFAEGWVEYGSWITVWRNRTAGSFAKAAVERLKELNLTRAKIGLPGMLETDAIQLPLSIYNTLRAELPEADFEGASGLIEDIRAVKSPEEIELMRKAQQIGDTTMDAMAEVIRPGALYTEVSVAAYKTMLSHGCDTPLQFIMHVGMSRGRMTFTYQRPFENGDIVLAEFSPRFHGYCGHLNKGFVVGDWPDEQSEKVYLAALASYRAGCNALRPGITIGELSKVFSEPVIAAGFTPRVIHCHGTGLGTETGIGCFANSVEPQASVVIREGITIGVEPGACSLDGRYAINMGDVVQVTRDGALPLTNRKLEIVICK
jgi:Xaa-Pro aminopeptidase